MVLTHLILNDMMKVRSHISRLALCLQDPVPRIAALAQLFFHELSCKAFKASPSPKVCVQTLDQVLDPKDSLLPLVCIAIVDMSPTECRENLPSHVHILSEAASASLLAIIFVEGSDQTGIHFPLLTQLCELYKVSESCVQILHSLETYLSGSASTSKL